jgi:excisionase family DNA binding protein
MSESPDSRELLTPTEAAAWLRVPVSWIYGRTHTHTLPFPIIRVGHYRRFRRADIERYLAADGDGGGVANPGAGAGSGANSRERG